MMKSYGLFGFIGFLCLPLVLALPARAEDSPQVFISEINWAGSEVSTADEWIELVNLGASAIDLSHYVLTGTATSGGAIEIAAGTVLEPNQTLLIANYALGDPKTTLLIAPDLVTTAISLPNSGLDILLTTPDGLVLDAYTDAGTPDFGISSPATSIERDLSTFLWQSSTQNLHLSSISQFGTPGSIVPSTLPSEPPAPIVDEPALPPPATGEIEGVDCEPIVIAPDPIIEEPETIVLSEPEPVIAATPVISPITPGELILNELVSDPLDGVEWVEILNTSSHDIDLTGSTLSDAGDHVTNLPLGTLGANAMIVIENPNGNLNNTTDTLKLLDSYGTLLDTLTYGTTDTPAPQDGESLGRNSDGNWLVTTATRNAINAFAAVPSDGELPETGQSPVSTANETYDPLSTNIYATTPNELDSPVSDPGTLAGPVEAPDDLGLAGPEPVHRIVAIAQPINEEAGPSPAPTGKNTKTQTVITGTVVALPDTFGKQTMFLDGHEIYFHAADWPSLALGDVVQVTGEDGASGGNPRLKIKSPDNIVIMSHIDPVAKPVDGSEFAGLPHGALVSIAGRVTGKSGNNLTIVTDDGVTITAPGNKRTGVSWSGLQTGNIVLSGIVKRTEEGIVLAVRAGEDVHYTPDTSAPVASTQKTKANTTPLVGGGLLTGSIGALGTWYLRSRKGLLSWLPF
jgi:hypothetical protein